MYPFFTVGFRYVSCNVLVEEVYVWVCWVCGAESVTVTYKLFSLVREVRDRVWDMSSGNVVASGCE